MALRHGAVGQSACDCVISISYLLIIRLLSDKDNSQLYRFQTIELYKLSLNCA